MRLPYQTDLDGVDVAIVGVPFDGGVSYRPGTRFGPREIRAQSSLIRPYNFGAKYCHGTTFRRAIDERTVDPSRMVQVGIRGPMYSADDLDFQAERGITVLDIGAVHAQGIAAAVRRMRAVATGPVYVSVDIDAVDPAFAPGTGTPEVGGLTSSEIVGLVRGLSGLDIVGFDLVEVSPPFDGPGQITSLLAAALAFEFLCALTESPSMVQRRTPNPAVESASHGA